MSPTTRRPGPLHSVSVVIPVYRGASTLAPLIDELLPWTEPSTTPEGAEFQVQEILLVHDHGGDGSDQVMRELAAAHDPVQAVWLSRNFGQHAATWAGISRTTGEWVATLDEDGQHDPRQIGALLDAALAERAQVVYAQPIGPAPQGRARGWASKRAKALVRRGRGPNYQSFRLLLGSLARSMAVRVGPEVYLDIALGWVVGRYAEVPTVPRGEIRPSGYTLRKLLSHFRRIVVTSGTRGLRVVSVAGILLALGGLGLAIWIIVQRLSGNIEVEGWASVIVASLMTSGAVLFSLGVIAEYLGVVVNGAMGRPGFLIVPDPEADSDPGARRTPPSR